MRIYYFSTARYPTEKAYGVTIQYTFQALKNLGHDVKIFSPADILTKKAKISKPNLYKILIQSEKFINILEMNSKNIFSIILVKILYKLKIIIVSFFSKYLLSSKIDLLWVREPLVCLFNFKKSNVKNILIEVHMNLSFIDKLILRVVQRSGKLAIAPISLELEKSLKKSWFNFDQTKMIFSPMAVPDSFFGEKSRIFLEDKNNITLSYVGSLYSTGYDQKIVDLIRCIEKINSQFPSRKIKFELFGIENELIPMLENKFRDMKLKGLLNINPRDLHENLIPKLRACDVFILPYPDGVFFRNRFPLKALEYAALFRPIFVTDTTSHRNIFNDEEVWFYKQGDCLELGNALMKLNLNSNETQLKLEAAYAKASKHKYSARVNKILKVISLNNN